MADVFTRSAKQEYVDPVPGKVKGVIPVWLKGSILRNGAGIFKIGETEMNHLFDGMAVIHRFNINNGEVTYQNRFLQSESFKRNMAANMIVISEFGTRGVPDPCQNLFSRYFSYFFPTITDNDCVNLIPYGGNAIYAVTETKYIHKIDPDTLKTEDKIDLSKFVNIQTASAHAHIDKDGTVYNIGTSRNRKGSRYSIIKFPVTSKDDKLGCFERAEILGGVQSSTTDINYYHSFAITDNYIIFIEQPYFINLKNFLHNYVIKHQSFLSMLEWRPDQKTKMHLFNRFNGERSYVDYFADPLLVFHHINAYEDNGYVIMDIVCYPDASVVTSMILKNLRQNNFAEQLRFSSIKRFVLPIEISPAEIGSNLVMLNTTSAKAELQENGSIYLKPETLSSSSLELPRINYDFYNGKNYRYVYGVVFEIDPVYKRAILHPPDPAYQHCNVHTLVKLDVKNKTKKIYYHVGNHPSEPIFIPRPEATEEDDGVVISTVLCQDDPTTCYMVVLDAKFFTEIAQVEFKVEIPSDFHGVFLPKQNKL